MAEHISFLTIIAMLSLLALVVAAVDNWVEYFQQRKRQRKFLHEAESLLDDLQRLAKTATPYKRLLTIIQQRELDNSAPWLVALKRIIPRQFSRQEARQELARVVYAHYRSLEQRAHWVKSISPSTGLFWTVIGMIAVLMKQASELDQQEMVGDIGVALITTAFATIVLVMEVTLLTRLRSLMEEEVDTGAKLVDQLIDRDELSYKTGRIAYAAAGK